jgi:hypothetical protein
LSLPEPETQLSFHIMYCWCRYLHARQ